MTNFRDSFNSISENFAAQFGIILYKVYKISYDTYKDIPRGEIKVFFIKEILVCTDHDANHFRTH